MILSTARSLVGLRTGYPTFGADALRPGNWDGRLNTIRELRCDGLIEVCYEINGIDVWGMMREPDNNAIHYNIADQTDDWSYNATFGTWNRLANRKPDNLEEHNDFDDSGWEDILMPATQAGYVAPVDAATRFERQNLCEPVGVTGGNP